MIERAGLGSGNESIEKTERNVRDQLELRLLYAEAFAEKAGLPVAAVLLKGTDLHARIFGYIPDKDGPPALEWAHLEAEIDQVASHADRLGIIARYEREYSKEGRDHSKDIYWPFRYDPPASDGSIRLHFGSMNLRSKGEEPSVLSGERLDEMIEKLTSMFTEIKEKYSNAKEVRGASWLYNREAYRRFFPTSYTEHATPRKIREFIGGGTWGQFRKNNGSVDQGLKAEFIERLKRLDPNDPHKVFPKETLMVSAPIEDFYKKYKIAKK